MAQPYATVVVPAHNEATVIGRFLGGVLAGARPGEFKIIVVANGCADRTAEIARGFGPDVEVIETPIPSKAAALRLGDAAAGDGFPRVYADADIQLAASDVRAVCAALGGHLAAAPERALDLAGSMWAVRWYYDVWTRLPSVRAGLFGRGVIAVGAEGGTRLAALPPLMADDLAASVAFAPEERTVVAAARVVIRPPRTFADLLRRRIRAATSVTEFEGVAAAPRTGLGDLVRLCRTAPKLAPKVGLFLYVAFLARYQSRKAVRKGDYDTWLRDESSRI